MRSNRISPAQVHVPRYSTNNFFPTLLSETSIDFAGAVGSKDKRAAEALKNLECQLYLYFDARG